MMVPYPSIGKLLRKPSTSSSYQNLSETRLNGHVIACTWKKEKPLMSIIKNLGLLLAASPFSKGAQKNAAVEV